MIDPSKSPITVKITNNMPEARTLQWLGKGQQWISANGTLIIDYEPLSCANRWQRENLLAALAACTVSLEISLLTDKGVVTVPYNPAALRGKTTAVSDGMAKEGYVPMPNTDNKSHIVMAGGGAGIATRMGFRQETPAPPSVQPVAGPEGIGFNKSTVGNMPGNSLTTEAIRDTLDKQAEEQQEEVPEDPSGKPLDVDALAKEFDALTADRKWAEALRLLVDVYGKEKINFSTRVLMSLKTFKAVAEKYDL